MAMFCNFVTFLHEYILYYGFYVFTNARLIKRIVVYVIASSKIWSGTLLEFNVSLRKMYFSQTFRNCLVGSGGCYYLLFMVSIDCAPNLLSPVL